MNCIDAVDQVFYLKISTVLIMGKVLWNAQSRPWNVHNDVLSYSPHWVQLSAVFSHQQMGTHIYQEKKIEVLFLVGSMISPATGLYPGILYQTCWTASWRVSLKFHVNAIDLTHDSPVFISKAGASCLACSVLACRTHSQPGTLVTVFSQQPVWLLLATWMPGWRLPVQAQAYFLAVLQSQHAHAVSSAEGLALAYNQQQ